MRRSIEKQVSFDLGFQPQNAQQVDRWRLHLPSESLEPANVPELRVMVSYIMTYCLAAEETVQLTALSWTKGF